MSIGEKRRGEERGEGGGKEGEKREKKGREIKEVGVINCADQIKDFSTYYLLQIAVTDKLNQVFYLFAHSLFYLNTFILTLMPKKEEKLKTLHFRKLLIFSMKRRVTNLTAELSNPL